MYTELLAHKNRPNVLYLNAGDNFQGTLWFNVYGWNVTQYFLNKLRTDIYVSMPRVIQNLETDIYLEIEIYLESVAF